MQAIKLKQEIQTQSNKDQNRTECETEVMLKAGVIIECLNGKWFELEKSMSQSESKVRTKRSHKGAGCRGANRMSKYTSPA
jgi:hypothetical protein